MHRSRPTRIADHRHTAPALSVKTNSPHGGFGRRRRGPAPRCPDLGWTDATLPTVTPVRSRVRSSRSTYRSRPQPDRPGPAELDRHPHGLGMDRLPRPGTGAHLTSALFPTPDAACAPASPQPPAGAGLAQRHPHRPHRHRQRSGPARLRPHGVGLSHHEPQRAPPRPSSSPQTRSGPPTARGRCKRRPMDRRTPLPPRTPDRVVQPGLTPDHNRCSSTRR
ncbi:hypothetical protein HBB16_09965 [Pseudonocardia sp. MCCB 268]|nr:hypothetical protein [Pseudonocardia cytotoxica]